MCGNPGLGTGAGKDCDSVSISCRLLYGNVHLTNVKKIEDGIIAVCPRVKRSWQARYI